jgi:adenosylcobinamide kinase / adenosylcobinamide-phosphate guanylyltransferase
MGKIILVTGGARSGKSIFAESLYKDILDVVYIATSKVCDDEMRDRVMLHKAMRPSEWKTFEGSYDLYRAVGNEKNYLLDCLTVLTSNIMFDLTISYEKIPLEVQREVENRVGTEIKLLVDKVREREANIVIVTNEVGYSIVPENHIARVYRDIIGKVNQRVAAICDEVYIVVCGIPLRMK